MALVDTWRDIQNFFGPQKQALKDIDNARFPELVRQQMFYGHRGRYQDAFNSYTEVANDLHQRYLDYEDMDDYPELSAALDMYADDATQPDFIRNTPIWFEGDNQNVIADLNFLIHNQLKIDSWIWEMSRYLAKYGNNYERMFVNENGVIATEALPVPLTRRVHDEYGHLAGFVVSMTGSFIQDPAYFLQLLRDRKIRDPRERFKSFMNYTSVLAFEDWEVAHFRLVGKDRLSDYGYSMLENARWVFRRLVMMEDAALVHKLTRAPSRYVFYVNTGTMPYAKALSETRRVRDMYKKTKLVDPRTGKLNMSYNAMAVDEDFFFPYHSDRGESVRVDSLMGADYQSMDDVEYFQRKLGKSVKIPMFGRDDEARDKPLSHEDVSFASAVMRLQRAAKEGIKKIANVHLVATGRDPDDFQFTPYMTLPSPILELARIEVLGAKADIMDRLGVNISIRWMLVNLFGFSEDESVNLMVMRQEELDMTAAAEAERDLAREKLMKSLGESHQRPWQERIGHKAMAGAFGTSPKGYESGKSPSPEAMMKEIYENHKDLAQRLDRAHKVLSEIKQASKFNMVRGG